MSPFEQLQKRAGKEWPAIVAARLHATEKVTILSRVLGDAAPADESIVVFGSIARGESTSGSDLDWCLLLDGPSNPAHFPLLEKIREKIEQTPGLILAEPGSGGLFGNMCNSHELIHLIGGNDDTNPNLTRRILLLLESLPISNELVHQRVVRQVIERYITLPPRANEADRRSKGEPRFLINDIVRYWRTVAVDYAQKEWAQNSHKWALRNAKLRLSRKLLFASGLLLCYKVGSMAKQTLPPGLTIAQWMAQCCYDQTRIKPIDRICDELLSSGNMPTVVKIFDSYDWFLKLLDDPERRKYLETLPSSKAKNDQVFNEVRKIGDEFFDGLRTMFFRDSDPLRQFIEEYGVF